MIAVQFTKTQREMSGLQMKTDFQGLPSGLNLPPKENMSSYRSRSGGAPVREETRSPRGKKTKKAIPKKRVIIKAASSTNLGATTPVTAEEHLPQLLDIDSLDVDRRVKKILKGVPLDHQLAILNRYRRKIAEGANEPRHTRASSPSEFVHLSSCSEDESIPPPFAPKPQREISVTGMESAAEIMGEQGTVEENEAPPNYPEHSITLDQHKASEAPTYAEKSKFSPDSSDASNDQCITEVAHSASSRTGYGKTAHISKFQEEGLTSEPATPFRVGKPRYRKPANTKRVAEATLKGGKLLVTKPWELEKSIFKKRSLTKFQPKFQQPSLDGLPPPIRPTSSASLHRLDPNFPPRLDLSSLPVSPGWEENPNPKPVLQPDAVRPVLPRQRSGPINSENAPYFLGRRSPGPGAAPAENRQIGFQPVEGAVDFLIGRTLDG